MDYKNNLIEVEHSGYSENRGVFCDLYYIDPDKTDYEICFPNGEHCTQDGAFHARTADWNHDGIICELYGAFFQMSDFNRSEFLTPEMMIRLVADEHCKILGIEMQTVIGKPITLEQRLKEADAKREEKNTPTDSTKINFER